MMNLSARRLCGRVELIYTPSGGIGHPAANLIGIFMNYGALRSEQYDIRALMVGCDYCSQPAYVFVARREVIRKHALTAPGARTEFRTFP